MLHKKSQYFASLRNHKENTEQEVSIIIKKSLLKKLDMLSICRKACLTQANSTIIFFLRVIHYVSPITIIHNDQV